ncbi:hypothetical protein JQS43_22350 [Natronosporangium hydrolyticum]|uniref:Uncharacterized protein n=1 Tax=Natronosporangium hydrolyticum TaxID=2811111 RepID=A0A895Y8Z8_9ACTN|nr:hypothetical protein [Natronosporangium hydrolyticum]QSB14224.1 hypothetical protein JQS43_22350 [Natronosporangium hydrolyticum]
MWVVLRGQLRVTSGGFEPCAVPTLVEHLQAHDDRIANLLSTRSALPGLIDSATPEQ